MKILDSLRWRLVIAMLLLFALGMAGATLLRPFERQGGLLSRLDVDLIEEPYQDLIVLLAFSMLATGLIWIVSGWSLRYLAEASREAGQVGPANPEARLTTGRLPWEVRPLVMAVNAALDRMALAYEIERRFVADAAHELRTPLTVLSLRLQQAKLSGALDWVAVEQDLGQFGRVVSQLLDLARKEAAGRLDTEPDCVVDICRVAREAAAMMLPLAEKASRPIELDFPVSLQVRGRADDLRDTLRNLLENALVHGRGPIQVSGTMYRGDDGAEQVAVTVADSGMKLSAAEREVMFERFRKADPGSSGSGLGLAIVREVVRSHGGTAQFLTGPETVVLITLPALTRS